MPIASCCNPSCHNLKNPFAELITAYQEKRCSLENTPIALFVVQPKMRVKESMIENDNRSWIRDTDMQGNHIISCRRRYEVGTNGRKYEETALGC